MFTSEEIKMLFDALDALESKAAMSHAMSSMFGAVLIRDEFKRKEFIDEERQKMESKEVESQIQKEQIILLKAKLIQMKDKAFVEELD